MADRLKQRTEQTPHVLKIIRDFIVERTAADEHYSEQLISIGAKYRGLVENRPEFCEFPVSFTTLIGDTEQSGLTRKQLKEQIFTEIYLPHEEFMVEKRTADLAHDMNYVIACLTYHDFEVVVQEHIKQTLTKLSVIQSILAESEDELFRRFGTDVENFNTEEYIQQIIKKDEPYFPKQESTMKHNKKKGLRVAWREQIEEVIGYSDTESKLPVLYAESMEEEEAFAEIASIAGRKANIQAAHEWNEDGEDMVQSYPYQGEEQEQPKKQAPAKKADPLDALDSFLLNARAHSHFEAVDDFEEKKKKEQEEKEKQEKERLEKEKEEKERLEKERLAKEKEEKERLEREEQERKEKEGKPKSEQDTEKKEPSKKPGFKPVIPPKPTLPHLDAEETSLKPIITETVSCQYVRGQLQRCDLAGQIAFSGTIRKDTRADFSFDFVDTSSIENVLPNKTFVQASSNEGLGFKCNLRALSHFTQQTQTTPALKYKVLGNSIASKVPLMVSVAWKCEEKQTSIIINYKGSPNSSMVLKDVSVEVMVSGGVLGLQAKPHATWNPGSQSAIWNLGSIEIAPNMDSSGKLLGRFSVQQASTPAPVSVQFHCDGTILSDTQLQLSDSLDIKWLPIEKRLATGKYLAS